MSGFEVVGVVLALFPIIVDGVRTYNQARSGQPLEHLIKDLVAEEVIFRSWIVHLLMPSVPVEALKGMLDSSPDKLDQWQDPGLQAAVERSFGTTITRYLLMTLGDIHKELSKIKEALSFVTKLEGDSIGSRFYHTLQSARHTREGSSARERLRRLQQLNAKLGQVFAVPRANAISFPASNLDSLPSLSGYDHATSIFHAIQNGYRCQCSGPHLTKMRLPPPKCNRGPLEHWGTTEHESAVSTLLFSVQEIEPETSSSRMIAQMETTSSPQESQSSLVSTLPPDDNVSIETSVPGRLARASSSDVSQSFSDLSIVGSNNSTNTSASRYGGRSRSLSVAVLECENPSAGLITDLCKTICSSPESHQSRNRSIGALPSVGDKTYELVSDQSSWPSVTQHLTSLEDLFTSAPRKLARGVRIELAVRLSTAVLQLCMTPWLDSAWSWRDFSMSVLQGGQLDGLSLFVAHQFFAQQQSQLGGTILNRSRGRSVMSTAGERVLTQLGFALIELAFGQRLVSMQGQIPNTSGDAFYRELAVAAALLESGQLLAEEGHRYHQAVLTCLKQKVNTHDGYGEKSLNLQDPSFQQDAVGAILQPLIGLWTDDFGGGVQ